MKKIIVVIMSVILCFGLAACGGDSGNSAKNESSDNSTASKYSFKDNIATFSDATIEITDYRVIPVGETGNEYGEKPVIAFWYKVTNNSAEDMDPSTAWILNFTAIQDNDANSVNELEVGMLPDDRFLDSQLEKIKVGGTVENAVAYELDDDTTPVQLIASDGFGEEIGKQTFDIK